MVSYFFAFLFSACLSISSAENGFILLRTFPEMSKIWNPTNLSFSSENAEKLGPCTNRWKFLSCSNNEVMQLFLSDQNLSKIDSSLFNSLNLQTLQLQNNNFNETIPSRFNLITSLKYLNLSNNNFYGNIPDTFNQITSLQFFDVSYNNLSGNVPINLQKFSCSNFVGNPLLNGILNSTQCFTPSPSSNITTTVSSSSSSSSSNIGLIVGIIIGLLFIIIIIGFVIFLFWRKKKIMSSSQHNNIPVEDDLEKNLTLQFYGQLKRYSLPELHALTDNFSESRVIGKGGFGTVFVAQLQDGKKIALKRLKMEEKYFQGKEFLNELEVLSHAVHKNILQIEGFCVENNERILIFPFISNGSVADYFLGGKRRRKFILSWTIRQKIAIGTAEGLAYMHNDCNPKLIHRDVKAANILLNEHFEPFVADFGLAKLMNLDHTHVTTKVRGTIGHIAPECFSSGKASEKSDVYSFGVFLVELVAGLSTLGIPEIDEENITLHDYVLRELNQPGLGKLVDPVLKFNESLNKTSKTQTQTKNQTANQTQNNQTADEVNAQTTSMGAAVQHMLYLAVLCLKISTNHRPTMQECVSMLKKDVSTSHSFVRGEEVLSMEDILNQPSEPHPSIPRSGSIGNSSSLPDSGEGFHFADVSVEAFALSGPR